MRSGKVLLVFGLIFVLQIFMIFPQPVKAMSSSDNVSITITDGTKEIIAGTTQDYTITVVNNGDNYVSSVAVYCKLPQQATNSPEAAPWSITSMSEGVVLGTNASSGNVYVVGILNDAGEVVDTESQFLTSFDMNARSSLTIKVTPRLLSSAAGTFKMEASLYGFSSSTDIDDIIMQSDISVTVTNTNTSMSPGGNTTFFVTAVNNGPSMILGAKLICPLPAGAESCQWSFSKYDNGGAYANPSKGTTELATTLNLPAGTSYQFWYSIKAGMDATAPIVANATISTGSSVATDPNPNNNSASCSVDVVPDADLSVWAYFDDQTGNAAGVVTYDIEVMNFGPSSTTNVTLSAPVPSGAVFDSIMVPNDTTYNKENGIWNVGNLSYGDSKILRFKVSPDYNTTQTAVASVLNSDTADSNTSNNSASLVITDRTDISMTIGVDNANPNAGDIVTYTLTATNNGLIKAEGVFVNAVLPSGLTYVSDDSGDRYDPTDGWKVRTLDSGTSKTIKIKATVNSSADQTFTATASMEIPDSDVTNNSAAVTISSKIIDKIPPVIVLNGDNPMTISYGSNYIEPGAIVTDNCDNGLTAVISGGVDTTKAGTYTVTYTAADRSNNTATVTRTVIVKKNNPPTAKNDNYSANKNTALTISAPGVLGNDTDIDGNSLKAVLVFKPLFGKLIMNADGSFSYTPNKYFTGIDCFSYYVSDGKDNSNIAIAFINVVKPANHAPAANSDKYSTRRNTVLKISVPGILGNDTDADGDSLKAVLVLKPWHGKLTMNADGSFNYTPDKNFIGTDSFLYCVSDGVDYSNIVTVKINVSKP